MGLGTRAVVACLLRDLAVPQESLAGQPCSAPTPSCCGSSEKGPEKGNLCRREEQAVVARTVALAGAELGCVPFGTASSATRILPGRRYQQG